MRKHLLIISITVLGLSLFAQEISHETIVVNIEVPVRVFDKGQFVENLTIDDFEVYEDGKLQNVVAVYLIKKTKIERKEEKEKFEPETSRTFYLFFEVTQYTPRMEDAINYFIQTVLLPGDNLTFVSPMKTYKMKGQTLEVLPKEDIVKQLKGILRRDAMMGSAEYRSTVKELTGIAKELSVLFGGGGELTDFEGSIAVGIPDDMDDGKLELLLDFYRVTLEKLEQIRSIDQLRLLEFAKYLKENEGQKYVFLFYQREFLPQIEPKLMAQALGAFQAKPHLVSDISSLFNTYTRTISIDVDKVKKAYADASVAIHFLFFTKPAEHIPGVYFEEHSEDIFAPFLEMSKATGGLAESSSNPQFLFEKQWKLLKITISCIIHQPITKETGNSKALKLKSEARISESPTAPDTLQINMNILKQF